MAIPASYFHAAIAECGLWPREHYSLSCKVIFQSDTAQHYGCEDSGQGACEDYAPMLKETVAT